MGEEATISETWLPQTLEILKDCFGNTEKEVLARISKSETFSAAQVIIWKYCGRALVIGRSLDSTIILMIGESGAGKSHSINVLYGDPNLCKVNDSESETSVITLIRKHLAITRESPTLKTTLNFVDFPGFFDSNSAENDKLNLAYMKRFKQSRVELLDRGDVPLVLRKAFNIQKTVYPNIVLFLVKSDGNRLQGSNSNFVKSLKMFAESGDYIDFKHNNFIVVLTHVMSPTKKGFELRLKKKTTIVKDTVRKVLGIDDVEVIPIENEPDGLPKKGDFYELPNGELSHLNLYEAMNRCLTRNQDLLAQLSLAWYFKSNCPDKMKKAELIESHIELDDSDLRRLRALSIQDVDQVRINLERTSSFPMYNMQCLGYGFCPVTEQIKTVRPLKENGDPHVVELGSSKFLLPAGMTAYSSHSSKFHQLSFMEKKQYENRMQHSYGLDAGMKLVVSTNLDRKWLEQNTSTEQHMWFSVVHETQVATLRLQDPGGQPKLDRFEVDLRNLPDEYDESTASSFSSFFSQWGTHLIHELALGGCVQFRCMLKSREISKQRVSAIAGMIMTVFREIFTAKPHAEISKKMEQLRAVGIAEESLHFTGGNPPMLVTLDSLDSNVLQTWASSVASRPAELRLSTKLYPYYNLLDGKKAESLRRATEEFLKSSAPTLEELLNRNDIGDQAIDDVVNKSSKWWCFPAGAIVSFSNGSCEKIENLNLNSAMATIALKGTGEKMRLGGFGRTKFCDYLHVHKDEYIEFICLKASNGKSLLVSPGHMIFQYMIGENVVVGKQAKYFQIGEKLVYVTPNERSPAIEFPIVLAITTETQIGAYCPLTSSGTLIVDGFLVTSYAHVDTYQLSHTSMLPLRVLRKLFSRKLRNKDDRKNWVHPYAKFLIMLRNILKS